MSPGESASSLPVSSPFHKQILSDCWQVMFPQNMRIIRYAFNWHIILECGSVKWQGCHGMMYPFQLALYP